MSRFVTNQREALSEVGRSVLSLRTVRAVFGGAVTLPHCQTTASDYIYTCLVGASALIRPGWISESGVVCLVAPPPRVARRY